MVVDVVGPLTVDGVVEIVVDVVVKLGALGSVVKMTADEPPMKSKANAASSNFIF